MWRPTIAAFLCILTAACNGSVSAHWTDRLAQRIRELDQATPGEMGVVIKRSGEERSVRYHSDRMWYLASTTKVLVAIALMQSAEAGELSPAHELTLQESDFVDGAGKLITEEPGKRFSLEELMKKMLVDSDSTAADLLIRHLGVERLNIQIRERITREHAAGVGPISPLLEVRRDAYAEVHPAAKNLTNRDFIELKRFKNTQERLDALAAKLHLRRDELQVRSLEEAFERYYRRGVNSGTLDAFAAVLERLVNGQLLSTPGTERILGYLERIDTGEHRIKAGLPNGSRFAQKTGTQIQRICNVGVIRHAQDARYTVVAACLSGFQDPEQAEDALRKLGEANS